MVDPENEYVAPLASAAPVKKIIGSKWLNLTLEFIGNTYNIALGAFVSSILYPWIGWSTILIMAGCAMVLKYMAAYFFSKIKLDKILIAIVAYKMKLQMKREESEARKNGTLDTGEWRSGRDEFKADDER